MVPLFLLSIAVVAVGVERFGYWRARHRRDDRAFLGELAAARDPSDRRRREALLMARLDIEMAQGETLLEAAGVIAPLLGLLGTVLGLMRTLSELGPQLILPSGGTLNGYAQVLVSTAMGLTVALIATCLLRLNQALRQRRRQQLELGLAGLEPATGDGSWPP